MFSSWEIMNFSVSYRIAVKSLTQRLSFAV